MDKIIVNNLTKVYGNNPEKALKLVDKGVDSEEIKKQTKQVVGARDINISVAPGECFVIMGLSGSGKSTLIRCINCIIRPTAGDIIIDGDDITKVDSKKLTEIRRTKMSMVFQRFALLPHRTILDNVVYGLEVQDAPKDERIKQALRSIEMVGLKGWEDYYPHNLSGGMQQRVGIARALATDPDILLMDEPFSALDPLIRQEMQDELIEIQKKLQKTIVFITHDLDEALKLGDRIALMKDGKIVQMGLPEDILLSPATEYVARFVENVNRSKALNASSVMVKPRSVIGSKDGPRTALRVMEKNGISSVFVTDRKGKLEGFITADAAYEAAEQGAKTLDSFIEKDVPVTDLETPLSELLDVLAHTKIPVAVVDEEKNLKGILVRGSVIAGIAGERSDEDE
ncbi:Glycine betaine ABC transporter, ATP-binding protein OtaA [Candidatus Syntrophocurvum alkaliphilum]|uniref:Quaternary amine transport ATP-binding protein n=1 Tax=Candidatus Syntrophocurvum alkaliphilum TaxID=2293317 RepID=A0A6I6D7E6_9FIRM|nr:glycine betaine/L-proline ABC transporter ATP-binding protein [Candidatus Syntrophocurvum alkaliphilum]QGT99033.1 Glycine betaine ABC transporter, ATP-binding protein OtaA [Candidatus Syntrophocurvum alkaliphilum]